MDIRAAEISARCRDAVSDLAETGRKYQVRRGICRVVTQKAQTDEHHQGKKPQRQRVVSESFEVKHESTIRICFDSGT